MRDVPVGNMPTEAILQEMAKCVREIERATAILRGQEHVLDEFEREITQRLLIAEAFERDFRVTHKESPTGMFYASFRPGKESGFDAAYHFGEFADPKEFDFNEDEP